MHEPLLAGRRSDHDWLGEFAPEPPAEERLLGRAKTLPVITRTAPPSFRPSSRGRTQPRQWMLLVVSAASLMVSAGAVILGLWMNAALTPVPISERPGAPAPARPVANTVSVPAVPEPTVQPEPVQETPVAEARPAGPPTTTASRTRVPPAGSAGAAAYPARDIAYDRPPPATGNDVPDILAVLDRYRSAFSSLNPASVRAAWPAADIRALAREFADIRRQTLAFDNCRIDVQGARAEADCAGRVSLVTRSGSEEPNIQSRRWTFTLLRGSGTWTILTATRD